MDNSTIGIKIADGTFFPILEEDSSGRKRLVLTTVNDDQGSVQIDLYKGKGEVLKNALYIGSLVIEDIMPAMKGEPEIELIIGIDKDGNLNAVAGDTGSEDKQSLSVSLESLDDASLGSPNFELDEDVFDEVPSFDDSDSETDSVFDDTEFDSMDEEVSSDFEDSFGELPSPDDDLVFGGEDDSDDEEPDFGNFESEEASISTDDDEDFSFDDDSELDSSGFDEDEKFGDTAFDDDEFGSTAFDDTGFDEESEESEFDDSSSFDDDMDFDSSGFEDESYDESDEPDYESESESYREQTSSRRRPLALIVILIIIIIILGIGAFLIIRGMNGNSVPPLEADKNPVTHEAAAETKPEKSVPEQSKPAETKPAPPAVEEKAPEKSPVTSEPVKAAGNNSAAAAAGKTAVTFGEVPPAGHGGGVWYRLKWGDTLWDLSNSFYRTPWLYGLIAVENNIKNPDVIYAGTDIIIPEN